MPVKPELRENGRVIYLEFTEPFTGQDFADSIKNVTVYYDNAADILHQLADVSKIRTLPKNVFTLSRTAPAVAHPKRGHLVIIGANSFIQVIGEAVKRMMRYGVIKFVSTEDDAWTYIRNVIAEESQSAHSS